MLHTVPLQSLLDWLSKPQGPTLMKASVKAAPYKALAIAVTKRMLYEESPPLVGVGLVYKPHYIFTMPYSADYVHLNIWHSAGSNKESENWFEAPHLLFVDIAVQHPILLDLAPKETMKGTGEPASPFSFRGFRHHTVWTQQPGGEMAHHIPFPHLLRENTSSLIEQESEKFPLSLVQGQKIAIVLRPPAKDHWDIASDLVLPLTLN